jgi:hypothetical protein
MEILLRIGLIVFLWAVLRLSAWAEVPIPIHSIYPCEEHASLHATERWIVGCSKNGDKQLLWSFDKKSSVQLPESDGWLQGDTLFRIGRGGGAWSLESQQFLGSRIFVEPNEGIGRIEGDIAVVGTANGIVVLERERGVSYKTKARPIGYYPPVILSKQVAWIEWEAKKQVIQVWSWKTGELKTIPAKEPLALVSEGNILAWSEPDAIHIFDLEAETQRTIPSSVRGALSLKDSRLCWAEWQGIETDILCSDGFELERKGAQFSPIQLETGMLFLEEQGVMWLKY